MTMIAILQDVKRKQIPVRECIPLQCVLTRNIKKLQGFICSHSSQEAVSSQSPSQMFQLGNKLITRMLLNMTRTASLDVVLKKVQEDQCVKRTVNLPNIVICSQQY